MTKSLGKAYEMIHVQAENRYKSGRLRSEKCRKQSIVWKKQKKCGDNSLENIGDAQRNEYLEE
jgi:hypothetical protein